MSSLIYPRFFHVYLGLLSAVFCISQKLTVLLIIGLVPLIVSGYVKKEVEFKLYKTNLFLMALYLMYLLGIIFTQHPKLAWGYAENKMSFFLLPLLFSFQPKFELRLAPVLLGLALGIVISSAIGIFTSIACYQEGGAILSCFTSVTISPIHHPSYFATFTILALAGVWWLYFKKEAGFLLKWIVPFSLFAGLMVLLCLSLSALLFFVLLIGFLILRWIYFHWSNYVFFAILVLSPILLVLLFSKTPVLKEDYAYTKKSLAVYLKSPNEFVRNKTDYKTGNEVRLIMWTITVQEIMEHPFGVGTGNVDDHLSERLSLFGQKTMALKDDKQTIQWNPHNQFLQTTLETGILGGILLLCYFLSAFRLAYKNKNVFFMILVLSFCFNALFESMLQRQSGIVFYAFWISFSFILLHQSESNKMKDDSNDTPILE